MSETNKNLRWLINTYPMTLGYLDYMWKKYNKNVTYIIGPPLPKELEKNGIIGLYEKVTEKEQS